MVQGFILEALTSKGKRGIRECMKVNLKKEKISDDPLAIKFLFVRDTMRINVKESDIVFYITHMQGLVGKRDIDYKLTVF